MKRTFPKTQITAIGWVGMANKFAMPSRPRMKTTNHICHGIYLGRFPIGTTGDFEWLSEFAADSTCVLNALASWYRVVGFFSKALKTISSKRTSILTFLESASILLSQPEDSHFDGTFWHFELNSDLGIRLGFSTSKQASAVDLVKKTKRCRPFNIYYFANFNLYTSIFKANLTIKLIYNN